MPGVTTPYQPRIGFKARTALLLGALLLPVSASFAQALQTAYISPTSNGTYADWNFSPYTNVNQGPGCVVGDTDYWSSAPGVSNVRESAVIVIPASIPANATINSVDVQVCQAKAVGGTIGATFQTFIRTDTTDTDSGTDITAADPSSNLTADIQTIPVNALRSSITTLEVGVLKTNTIDFQRIYTIAGRINYTLAVDPTPAQVPVFGPFGLLLTMLGLGILGGWHARRSKA
jgi:hypothetical protein